MEYGESHTICCWKVNLPKMKKPKIGFAYEIQKTSFLTVTNTHIQK